ncbi:acyltransferase [Mucilaginibacter galii]|uniref:acyltransferase family protein n=1 Tax=Mucilaginibacter galii TaxID=2005073 RepID=UPI0016687FE3|nr:acyltransferase [Mucilaginibacter galii]
MSRNKINALESLRGFASIYVAVGHWILWNKLNPIFDSLFKFGTEAVTTFFLLSGFVIFYSTLKSSDINLKDYFIRRFRRIYFPFVCAIIVSIAIYQSLDISLSEFLGNLFLLQDQRRTPGNIVNPFLGNQPLWSLSYEWIFYLIFPFIFRAIKNTKRRVHIVGVFSLLSFGIYLLFPNHILLVFAHFILWWTGLELAEYFFGDRTLKRCKTLIIYYVLFIALLAVNWWFNYSSTKVLDLGSYPFLPLRQFCFAFICLLSVIYLTKATKILVSRLDIFIKVAPISYSIYILHFPILIQLHIPVPFFIEIPLKLLLLIGSSYLIEVIWQPKINKYLK